MTRSNTGPTLASRIAWRAALKVLTLGALSIGSLHAQGTKVRVELSLGRVRLFNVTGTEVAASVLSRATTVGGLSLSIGPGLSYLTSRLATYPFEDANKRRLVSAGIAVRLEESASGVGLGAHLGYAYVSNTNDAIVVSDAGGAAQDLAPEDYPGASSSGWSIASGLGVHRRLAGSIGFLASIEFGVHRPYDGVSASTFWGVRAGATLGWR
jgi:hypothetical protein